MLIMVNVFRSSYRDGEWISVLWLLHICGNKVVSFIAAVIIWSNSQSFCFSEVNSSSTSCGNGRLLKLISVPLFCYIVLSSLSPIKILSILGSLEKQSPRIFFYPSRYFNSKSN